MKIKPKLGFTYKVLRNDKVIQKFISHKYRQILQKIQGDKNLDCTFYICVRYGTFSDNAGKNTLFRNEGFYSDKKKLLHALSAFYECS